MAHQIDLSTLLWVIGSVIVGLAALVSTAYGALQISGILEKRRANMICAVLSKHCPLVHEALAQQLGEKLDGKLAAAQVEFGKQIGDLKNLIIAKATAK